MSESEPRDADKIEEYFDGLMDSEQRQAFERVLESDADFRADEFRQKAIEQSLNRLYVPPLPDEILARVPSSQMILRASKGSQPVLRRWRRSFTLAAAIAIGFLAVWRLWTYIAPPRIDDPYGPKEWRSMETVYADVAKAGFKPAWLGRNEADFARAFERRFGEPLLLSQSGSDVVPVGVGYCNTITPSTMCVITRVRTSSRDTKTGGSDGVGVLVFVDSVNADPAMAMPGDSQLKVFRRQLGQLALFEVTPLDKSYVLDLFYQSTSKTP